MKRIEKQTSDQAELATQVLLWVTCAKRPLTASELQRALAVEADEPEFDEENVLAIEDLVSVCAGVVVVDSESRIVRLVHHTTQDYLKRTQNYWFPNAEREITKVCFTYLLTNNLDYRAGQMDIERPKQRLRSLYNYASQNWVQHAHSLPGT